MNYKESREYIKEIKSLGVRMGLERISELLFRMGNPEKRLKFAHVAGTNGKGSVCAMLAASLQEAGYRTGLYTSPYVLNFNERIKIDGKMISDGEFSEVISFVKKCSADMQSTPTEFETVTAAAFEYFTRKACDIVVLEVGMGGADDATNVIESPEVAIITAIAVDHIKELGSNVEQISKVKAGIIKTGCNVIFYGNDPIAEKVFLEKCRKQRAVFLKPDFKKIEIKERTVYGSRFNYMEYADLYIPLPGEHQAQNATLVIEAVKALKARGWNVSGAALKNGLKKAEWRGRFELLHDKPAFIIDGGHNPNGASAAADTFRNLFPGKKAVILIGVMADKDIRKMLEALQEFSKEFITFKPDNPRAMDADALAGEIRRMGRDALAAASPHEAVFKAFESAGEDGVVLAIGSLYMYSEIYEAVREIKKASLDKA